MAFPTDGRLAAICAATYSAKTYAYVGPGDVRATLTQVDDYVVVANRGTILDGDDILRDIRFLPWWNAAVGFCPAGFLKGARSIITKLIADVGPTAKAGKLVFTGHSLGGSEALIEAGWFAALGFPPAGVVVFEPARAGREKLMGLLATVPAVRWYHDGNDPVPIVPGGYLLPPEKRIIGKPRLNAIECHRIAQVQADLALAGIA